MENENKLSLRLDETLETLTNWLNSMDAICYRQVILNYNAFSASDNLGLGELELVSVSGGIHSYVQQVKDYSIPLRNCGVQIQYDLFPLKTGVVVKLSWDRETSGAVWDLLREIARLWPETREDIFAWQASENGQAAREKAQQEERWQSPDAKRIRMMAEVAFSLQWKMKKEAWEALPAEEREIHEDAISAWGRLVDEVQGVTISLPSDDVGAPVDDIEGQRAAAGEKITQGGEKGKGRPPDSEDRWQKRFEIVKEILTIKTQLDITQEQAYAQYFIKYPEAEQFSFNAYRDWKRKMGNDK